LPRSDASRPLRLDWQESWRSGIFYCYRRDVSAGFAGRLDDALTQQFGPDLVFRDLDDIVPGDDFADAITRAVGSCAALLVVIGPRWLTLKGADGQPRLEHPLDYVRLEICHALERDIRVIPILVGGARMPGRDDLPPDLAALARRQAHEISESRWDYDVGALTRVLSSIPGIERPPVGNPRDTPEVDDDPADDPPDETVEHASALGVARGFPRVASTTTLTGSLAVLFAFVIILGIAFVRERRDGAGRSPADAGVAVATEDAGDRTDTAATRPHAVRAPIEAFVRGIREREVSTIVAAYPAMSARDQAGWRRLLGSSTISDVRATYDMAAPLDVRDEVAAGAITLAMGWRNGGTDHRCAIDYDLRLGLRGSAWKITSMAERKRKGC
jgi:hypothetical protein